MALAVRSVEAEQHKGISDVVQSFLPVDSPRELLGKAWEHVWWDTPLSTIVNAAAAKVDDVASGIRRNVRTIGAIVRPPPFPLEYAELAQAFARAPLRVRHHDQSHWSEPSAATAVADSGLRRRPEQGGYSPWSGDERSFSPPPTRSVPPIRRLSYNDYPDSPQRYNSRQRPLTYNDYADPPRVLHRYKERRPPRRLPQTPFEVEFLSWSPQTRVEYMRELVRRQELEEMQQRAALEEAVGILLAQMNARHDMVQQRLELAQGQLEAVLAGPPALHRYATYALRN